MNDIPEPQRGTRSGGPDDPGASASAGTSGSSAAATGRLLRALAVMGSGTMVSRLLGFLRVMLAAFVIGNGTRQAETYALALTIPNALYILFAGGALNSVFVPQLTRAARRDSDRGEAYTNRITTAFLTILLIVAVVATIATPFILQVYASPEWRTPAMADHYRAAIILTMVCMPEVFFYGAFVVFGQILNARDRFGPMMWAPVASNLIQILAFALFFAIWGQSPGTAPFSTGQIWLLGGGYLLGSILQAGVLIHVLRKVGYRYRPRFDLKGTGLGKTFRLAGWALGFVLVNQVALVVVSRLATAAPAAAGEAGGAGLNVYNNAYLIFLLPHSLITVSLVTAMVTSASKLAASGDTAGTSAEVMRTMRLVTAALVPAAFLLIALGHPIAQLLFGNGRDDAHFVGWTIMAFAVGLVPFTIQSVCLRTYYALERNKDTFLLQILIAGVQIGMSLLLVVALPIATPSTIAPLLALSFALAYYTGLAASFRRLRRYLPELSAGELARHLGRVSLAILPGAVLGWLITDRLGTSQPMRLVALVLAGVVAFGSCLLLTRLLGVTEITSILARLRGRRGAGEEATGPGDDGDPALAGARDVPDDETVRSVPLGNATEADLPTRVQPVVNPMAVGLAPPYDPQAPTMAMPAGERPTEAQVAVPRQSAPADPDAPTARLATGGPPADEDAGDIEDTEDSEAGVDDEAVDTAEEIHPIRVRPGRVLGGRYQLDGVIVRRTETQTWLAHDRMLSRPVLIHLLPVGQDDDELMAAARRAAVATDSRFLRVLDAHTGEMPVAREPGAGSVDAEPETPVGPYIVCEYAPGQSLEQLLAAGPLSALEAAWVVREVADGLAGMHEQGLYHERINPDTVVITATGNVKIVGFLLESELAPARHHPLTDTSDPEAIDVADLGRLLYCTLVSRWPGGHAHGMAGAPTDSEGHLLTPRQVRAGVSPALDSICDRILSPMPRHREEPLRTAHDVVRALNHVLGTANAAQDLERRLRYPVPVVEVEDETPASTHSSGSTAFGSPLGSSPSGFGTAAGLPSAPLSDPDAPTGRIPVVSRDVQSQNAESPTGRWAPVTQATPSEPEENHPRTVAEESAPAVYDDPGHHAEDTVHGDPPHRWIGGLIILVALVLIGSLVAVGSQMSPTRGASQRGDLTLWPVRAATDFDPEGSTREENPDEVPLAWDGDPATAWSTVEYARGDLSGKAGVGIIFDLGEAREVAYADLALVNTGTSVELRIPATDPDTAARPPADRVDQWRSVAAAERAPAQVTLTPDSPIRTRFVLVFLTELPPDGASFESGIAEAAFWG